MAYITAAEAKIKRDLIKKTFPAKKGFKFSITVAHMSTLNVNILKAPFKFEALVDQNRIKGGMVSANQYGTKLTEAEQKFVNELHEIANEGNYNNSDIMTDYFDVGFYMFIQVGKWNNPFISTLETEEKTEVKIVVKTSEVKTEEKTIITKQDLLDLRINDKAPKIVKVETKTEKVKSDDVELFVVSRTVEVIEPKDLIGRNYYPSGLYSSLEHKVIDFISRTNSKGDVIKSYFISEYYFNGQTTKVFEVPRATVIRGLVDQ